MDDLDLDTQVDAARSTLIREYPEIIAYLDDRQVKLVANIMVGFACDFAQKRVKAAFGG